MSYVARLLRVYLGKQTRFQSPGHPYMNQMKRNLVQRLDARLPRFEGADAAVTIAGACGSQGGGGRGGFRWKRRRYGGRRSRSWRRCRPIDRGLGRDGRRRGRRDGRWPWRSNNGWRRRWRRRRRRREPGRRCWRSGRRCGGGGRHRLRWKCRGRRRWRGRGQQRGRRRSRSSRHRRCGAASCTVSAAGEMTMSLAGRLDLHAVGRVRDHGIDVPGGGWVAQGFRVSSAQFKNGW